MNVNLGEPGARMPAPDGGLRILQAFVNTADLEQRDDVLAARSSAERWLAGAGLLARPARLSGRDQARLIELREALRRLASANNGEHLEPAERDEINRVLSAVVVVPHVEPDGRLAVRGKGRGVDEAIGRLIDTVARAMADGTWRRLKACRMHSCRWVFWDDSRNRSGTWCTMSICGSRQKSRAYRRRLRRLGTS